jgi:hypothetical protein
MRKHDGRSAGPEVMSMSLRGKNLFNLMNLFKMPGLPVYCGRAKRAGFSLVLVLLVAIIGSAIMGSVIYMLGGFAGGSRATMRSEEIYIQMQDEIERAKAELKLRMNSASDPMKMSHSGTITSMDNLIIHDGSVIFAPANVNKNVTYGGQNYVLEVRIFDMQYPAANVNDTDPDLVAALPPCMESVASDLGDNIGVYLIRATLRLNGAAIDTIETSVIQSIG